MARTGALDRFVRKALTHGARRDEIAAALADAGWRDRDVRRALDAYVDRDFVVPVPRPQPFVSARDAFLYGLTFVALVICVVNLASALFELAEWALRDDARLRLNWDLAALAVFAPVFALLDRRTRGDERDSPMRKIFAYGALFVAALVLLGDLVAALALALSGGLGLEVAVKCLVVAVISGAVFAYYRRSLADEVA
ncbi:hypothetical protein ILP92_14880 [Maribius pontilimi]|uniref:DUF5671 domain-containing protein n=1 Tax=Palleronia pontilimi TaxID=1964209 RepID=A0A934IGM5_9RHOB|nr:DUF5671 domain-containing protein [Palleronia pontilimi]MBJ3764032.1 hypothetical protein [Palleronia pontilimi]